jgi:hypothetical protein
VFLPMKFSINQLYSNQRASGLMLMILVLKIPSLLLKSPFNNDIVHPVYRLIDIENKSSISIVRSISKFLKSFIQVTSNVKLLKSIIFYFSAIFFSLMWKLYYGQDLVISILICFFLNLRKLYLKSVNYTVFLNLIK